MGDSWEGGREESGLHPSGSGEREAEVRGGTQRKDVLGSLKTGTGEDAGKQGRGPEFWVSEGEDPGG